MAANSGKKSSLGISGKVNTNGNDGTITRFGWKAQNKSLAIFAGEAYNVEQGVTNELFPDERLDPNDPQACISNSLPEDFTGHNGEDRSDVMQFALFMEFLAPPKPVPLNQFTQTGANLFSQVGCDMCHTPTMQTGASPVPQLSNVKANLYSDLLLHDMGPGLADGISQGAANGNEFRTAPLWGVGQRIFFLHDGRTKSLVDAINAHAGGSSEANQVVANFKALSPIQQEEVMVFLRSL